MSVPQGSTVKLSGRDPHSPVECTEMTPQGDAAASFERQARLGRRSYVAMRWVPHRSGVMRMPCQIRDWWAVASRHPGCRFFLSEWVQWPLSPCR